MAKYRVYMSADANATVFVEAESEEEVLERVWEEAPTGLCYQCSGGQFSNFSLDLGDFEIEQDSKYGDIVFKAIELVKEED